MTEVDRSEEAPSGRTGPVDASPDRSARRRARLEFVAVIVLSAVTILTAWSAFQSSKWGGAMSIAFSRASTARIEASTLSGAADARTAIHVGLWTEWVAAKGQGDEPLAEFLLARFPEPLATAHAAWIDAGGVDSSTEQSSPFAMPEYVLSERVAAAEASARADALFQEALRNNQRADNYTILTVLFAAVLFFTAMSSRTDALRIQVFLLGFGITLGVAGLAFLLTFPKLV